MPIYRIGRLYLLKQFLNNDSEKGLDLRYYERHWFPPPHPLCVLVTIPNLLITFIFTERCFAFSSSVILLASV